MGEKLDKAKKAGKIAAWIMPLVTAIALAASAQVRSCAADRDLETAMKMLRAEQIRSQAAAEQAERASDRAGQARVKAAMTDVELTVSYRNLKSHYEKMDRKLDMIEEVLLRIATRSAVREYREKGRVDDAGHKKVKPLADSPREALMQAVLTDPLSVLE